MAQNPYRFSVSKRNLCGVYCASAQTSHIYISNIHKAGFSSSQIIPVKLQFLRQPLFLIYDLPIKT